MKKELLLLSLSALALAPHSLLAQDRDANGYLIPDEVNKTKYFNIYEESKKASDKQRAAADRAKAKAQGIDSRISSTERSIVNDRNTISAHHEEIERMALENPRLEQENTRLSSEARNLRDDIRVNDQERGRLQTDRDGLQSDQDGVRSTYTDVTRTLQVNQTDIDNNNSAISADEGRQAQLNADNQRLDDRNRDLNEQIQAEGQRLADLINERRQRSDRMGALHPEMERLRQEVIRWADLAADKEEKIRRVQQFVDFTRNQLLDLDAKMEVALGRSANLQGKLKDLRKVKKALDTRLAELEKTKKVEKARSGVVAKEITRLSEVNPKLETEISTLGTEITSLENDKIAPLKEKNKQENQNIKKTRKELNETVKNAVNDPEVKKLIAGKEAELKVITDKIDKKKSSIANELIQIEQMEKGLEAMNAELAKKKSEKSIADADLAKIANLKKAIKDSKDKLKKLETSKASLEASIERLTQTIADTQAVINDLSPKIKAADDQQRHFDKEYDKYKKKYRLSVFNRDKYKKKYRAAKAKRDEFRAERDRLMAQLAPAKKKHANSTVQRDRQKDQIASAIQEMGVLNSKITESQNGLNAMEQTPEELKEISSRLAGEIAQVESNISQVTTALNGIKGKVNPVLTQISGLEKKAKKKQGEIDAIVTNPTLVPHIAAEVNRLKGIIKASEDAIAVNNVAIGVYQDQVKAKKKQKKKKSETLLANKESLTKFMKELEELKKKVEPRNKQIAETKQKIAAQVELIRPIAEQKRKVERRIAELEQQTADMEFQFNNQSQFLREEQAELEAFEGRWAEASEAHRAAAEENEGHRVRIENIDNTTPQIESFLSQSNGEVRSNSDQIGRNNSELDGLERRLSGLYETRNRLASFRELTLERQAELLGQINGLQGQIDDLDSRISGLDLQNDNLNAEASSRENQVIDNENTISENKESKIRLERDIRARTSNISSNQRSLESLRPQSRSAWLAFNDEDVKALKLELITKNDRGEFEQRRDLYASRLADSIDSGQSQGNATGSDRGDRKGEIDGGKAGSADGGEIGAAQGEFTGYREGLKKGLVDGKREGYEHGSNLNDVYEEAFEAGYASGRDEVYAEAQQNAYPEGRMIEKKRQLSKTPENSVDLDNSTVSNSGPIGMDDFEDSESDLNISNTEFEFYDNRNGEYGVDGIRTKIEDLRVRLGKLSTSFDSIINNAGVGVVVKVNVNSAEASCNDSYQLFVDKCRESYGSSYKEAYTADYKAAYTIEYKEKAKESRSANYDNSLENKRKAGHTEAYKVAYAKWDAIGAEDNQKEGFSKGKSKGYAENKKKAYDTERSRGVKDEARFFATNPVIRTGAASVASTESGFYPGSTVRLNLAATNFGGEASKNGQVRVSLRAGSNNVRVLESGYRSLISIPAKSQANISNVLEAKIGNNVRPGERVTLYATTQYPYGETKRERVVLTTQRHVSAAMELKFEAKPKVKGIFYKTHEIEVALNNTSRSDLDKNFKVQVTSDSKYVEVKKNAETDVLSRGEALAVELKYKFNSKKARGKAVNLTVKVLYGDTGRVLSQKVITVYPK